MSLLLRPTAGLRLHGTLRVPSDKSITQRALLLSAVSQGTTRIVAPLRSEDSEAVARCVSALGAAVEDLAPDWRVHGRGPDGLRNPSSTLDARNSGTGARLMLGLLAGQRVTATIDGDESLRRRPMARVVNPLRSMGASIFAPDPGHLPLQLRPSAHPLVPFRGRTEVSSAQVKSAILLAALGAHGTTELSELQPTRDHTERLLPRFGVDCGRRGDVFWLRGPAALHSPGRCTVPADPSSAAILAAGAALFDGSELRLPEVLLHERRNGFFSALRAMGAHVEWSDSVEIDGERRATLTVRSAPLRAVEIAAGDVADMIDELPLIAVLATRARGVTSVRGAGELRVKESDRIHAMVSGLRALGATVQEFDDGFSIQGPAALRGTRLEAHQDHRIAMALTLAALCAEGDSELDEPCCVAVSYPTFFADLVTASGGDQRIFRKL